MYTRSTSHRGNNLRDHARWFARAGLSIALVLLCCGLAAAQEDDLTLKDLLEAPTTKDLKGVVEKPPAEVAEGTGIPEDKFDRGTPQSAVSGFMLAARNADYERAAEYLDLRRIPRGTGENPGRRLALWLHLVAQQKLERFNMDKLSRSARGNPDDGLAGSRDLVGRIPGAEGYVEILVERVPREDGVRVWKFSATTVDAIPLLYAEHGYGRLGDVLPAFFFGVRLLYIQLWQWIAIAVLVPLCVGAGWLASRGLEATTRRFRNDIARALGSFMRGPLWLLTATLIFSWVKLLLGLSKFGLILLTSVENVLLVFTLAWTAMRASDTIFEVVRRRLLRRGQTSVVTLLLPTISKITKGIVLTLAMLVLFDNLGFSVTTLLAGMSVAGVTVALAAQKTIENFIGGITLYADQPVRVGDFCRFGETLGTVEEVGLRSTRIRTLDRTVISVPNGEFVNLHLDNFNRRDKIWFHPTIRLRYETSPDQIRYILIEVRKLLYGHPRVDSDGARIRFKGFAEYSLDLEIFAYVTVTDTPSIWRSVKT